MSRVTFIAPESNAGQVVSTSRVPDIATIMSNTKYALRPERVPTDMGPKRGISSKSGGKGRMGRGAGMGAVAQDYFLIGSDRHPKLPGNFAFEMEICQPGSGVAWSTTPVWHILRSRYALDTAAITSDTVTGVSTIRLTPATPASWQTGDLGVCRLNARDYAFQVTGRTGNDILINPGLPSVVAGGTTVRLCHRLYVKPGSEGQTFTIIDHGVGILWLGTHCRLGSHSFKMDPGNGRLILAGDITVGCWVRNHAAANPYTALGASPVGGPALMGNLEWRIDDDYYGPDSGGGLTVAPWSAASIEAFDHESLEITIDAPLEVVASGRDPTGVCAIKGGDMNAAWMAPMCTYDSQFNADPGREALRTHAVCAGPMVGAGTGVVFFMGSAQVDPATVPDATEPTTTREKQTLKFLSTTYGQPVDESPGVGSATADAALCHWQIGLVQ